MRNRLTNGPGDDAWLTPTAADYLAECLEGDEDLAGGKFAEAAQTIAYREHTKHARQGDAFFNLRFTTGLLEVSGAGSQQECEHFANFALGIMAATEAVVTCRPQFTFDRRGFAFEAVAGGLSLD